MSFKFAIEINCFAFAAVKVRARALRHIECKAVQKPQIISGLGFAHRPGVYAWKPGMGIEPTYSGSAGRRLNRSATPALHGILLIRQ